MEIHGKRSGSASCAECDRLINHGEMINEMSWQAQECGFVRREGISDQADD